MIADLHCHTTVSDGSLEPEALLARAVEQGVELLAITDHDTVDAYTSLFDGAFAALLTDNQLQLIPGVELSCVWGKHLIHIVGLNIDIGCTQLVAGLEQQKQARAERAVLIASRLEKLGFTGGYEFALQLVPASQIGRPHFARFLLEKGYVKTQKEAFKRYLGAGKIGDVKVTWPAMQQAIDWIVAAGGVAVLAHPLHYKMTATKLRALIGDFQQQGGQAMEVVNGVQTQDKTHYLTGLCERFGLAASIGSDFHAPGAAWSELGRAGFLPASCRPVWEIFSDQVNGSVM